MLPIERRAWLAVAFVALVMSLLLFLPAGTFAYWQAWVYLVDYIGCSALITQYLIKHDLALLERRLSGGPGAEKEQAQRVAILAASIAFIALLVVPALDHRFGWSRVPVSVVVLSDILTALCFYVVFLVFKENTFTSATVEIAEDQRVISSGPYAYVRHPMYAGALPLCFAMPLALGSYWGLLGFLVMLPTLILRLLHEEKFLAVNLPGYINYCTSVRWRLLPGIF